MAQQIAADGGSDDNHAAADLETVVVDPDDVVEMFKRNARDRNEQRSHVLRVTPPLKGEQTATLHVSENHTLYPKDMDPKPLHIGERLLFASEAGRQVPAEIRYPDIAEDKQLYMSDADPDIEWDEWRETSLEVWESNLRNAMRESRTIELGSMVPESPETTVEIRFESADE